MRRLRQLDCDPEHPYAVTLLRDFADEDAELALRLVAKGRGRTSPARGPRAARLARFLLDSERQRGTLDEWRAYERGRAA